MRDEQRVREPGMLLAGVVGHNVHEDVDAAPARLGDEPVEVVHGAELGRDGAEVRHVVAPVGVGGHGDRREPDAVHAEPCQMVEVLGDARDVTDAVGVAVSEGTWIDLVQDAGLPPRFVSRRHVSEPTWPAAAPRQGERSSIG